MDLAVKDIGFVGHIRKRNLLGFINLVIGFEFTISSIERLYSGM